MTWDVEYMNEFGDWWTELAESEQDEIASVVELLAEHGPGLRFPYSAGVAGFRHGHMRELRVQSAGKPIRVFYACTRRRQDGQRAVLQAVRAAGRQAILRALAGTERRRSGRHAFDELTKGFTPTPGARRGPESGATRRHAPSRIAQGASHDAEGGGRGSEGQPTGRRQAGAAGGHVCLQPPRLHRSHGGAG